MSKRNLSPAMIKELEFAVAHDGDTRITHSSVKRALLERGLVRDASGYGWGYGGIQEITEAGRQALAAAQQLTEADLLPARCPECGGEVGNHRALCPLA